MGHVQSLNHTKRKCKYHEVWIPKYRKKSLYVELRKYLGSTLRDIALQEVCQVVEGCLLFDHIHILISIPPKYSVSQVVGYLKSESAIYIARTYMERVRQPAYNYSYGVGDDMDDLMTEYGFGEE